MSVLTKAIAEGIVSHQFRDTKLFMARDHDNFRGYGETLKEAVVGMKHDRRSQFTPFHRWRGDVLEPMPPGYIPEWMTRCSASR